MQPHHFHQQLVGVGGAVEGAGARPVVSRHLRREQLVAARLALGIALPHVGLFLVGQARGHRPCRDEQRRQVTEAQRAHQQARNDLVAYPQVQRGIEHVVRQRHRAGHGDHFATGNTQFHARLALRDTVAHGRHATGELPDRTQLAQGLLDLLGELLIRLMRRQHVVVGGHDGDVGRIHQAQRLLVVPAATGNAMGEVGALQLAALRPFAGRRANHLEVALARGSAALDKTVGHFDNTGMHEESPD